LWRFRTSDLDAWAHFEVKVSQLSVPSLTKRRNGDETDEISARQPSDREARRWRESLGVPMVCTPSGRRPTKETSQKCELCRSKANEHGRTSTRKFYPLVVESLELLAIALGSSEEEELMMS